MNLNQIVNGIVLDKACSIKPDKDSNESKTINLAVKFDGIQLGDVFAKAMSSAVIQWQNGPGRKMFDQWTNGQTVELEFKSPGRAPSIPLEVQMANKLAGMTTDERTAYFNELIKQAEKAN